MRPKTAKTLADGDLHDYETNVDIDKLNIIPKEPFYKTNLSLENAKKDAGKICRNSVQGKVRIDT